MKRIVSTLIPAVLAMPALAAPADDAAIRHVIEQHYNRPWRPKNANSPTRPRAVRILEIRPIV